MYRYSRNDQHYAFISFAVALEAFTDDVKLALSELENREQRDAEYSVTDMRTFETRLSFKFIEHNNRKV